MVPLEGLEPPRLSAKHFECSASTIPPQGHNYLVLVSSISIKLFDLVDIKLLIANTKLTIIINCNIIGQTFLTAMRPLIQLPYIINIP